MTDILGYDVNGEPLRAGDRAVYVGDFSGVQADLMRFASGEIEVIGPGEPWAEIHAGRPTVRVSGTGSCHAACGNLRKLKDDSPGKEHYKDQHKPCGLSPEESLKGFGRVEA